MTSPIAVETGMATHAGLRRALNEDSFLAASPVFMVADGMGGHEAGDRASSAVIDELRPLVERASIGVDDVRAAIGRARARINALSEQGSGRAGTTLSGVAIAAVDGNGYWLTVNIGDSRTYRWAGGELEQITVDHSVVQELIDAGQLRSSDAQRDHRRNIITRALGAGSSGETDYWMIPAAAADRILVCSDGLTSEVPDAIIAEVLRDNRDPQSAADQLIDCALQQGGRDNITAIVIDALRVSSRRGDIVSFDSDGLDIQTRPRAEAIGGRP
ncbi:PP2C family protein-serine/threonine phosphatase [Microbacterium sp. YY-01]|uniref:PP2C family protein-serine/threonine phosphatase n=1 Tax=Microbacterium sp. YY-01 TaxID=3421634 RepID=UPI003D174F37